MKKSIFKTPEHQSSGILDDYAVRRDVHADHITAKYFFGDGSHITNLPSGGLSGASTQVAVFNSATTATGSAGLTYDGDILYTDADFFTDGGFNTLANVEVGGVVQGNGTSGTNYFSTALDVDSDNYVGVTDYQMRIMSDNPALACKFGVEADNLAGFTLRSANGSSEAKNWQQYVSSGGGMRYMSYGMVNDAFTVENYYMQIIGSGYYPVSFNFMSGMKVSFSDSNYSNTPTARLHIIASPGYGSDAPLKIDPGTLLSTPESGAIETDGTNLYWTDMWGTRYQLN